MFMPGDYKHMEQLLILGIKEDYLYGLLLLMGLIILYSCIKPFITWLIQKKARAALTYLISSLGILVLTFGASLLMSLRPLEGSAGHGLKITLQWLAISGGVLIIAYIYRQLKSRQKRSI